jgi:hypothetical protein
MVRDLLIEGQQETAAYAAEAAKTSTCACQKTDADTKQARKEHIEPNSSTTTFGRSKGW